MDNISSFLQRFKNLLSSKASLVHETTEALQKTLGVTLESKHIKIRDNVLYIQAPPIVKNILFIKKSLLLQSIKERTGVTLTDIR